jgi:hypothetical protein
VPGWGGKPVFAGIQGGHGVVPGLARVRVRL